MSRGAPALGDLAILAGLLASGPLLGAGCAFLPDASGVLAAPGGAGLEGPLAIEGEASAALPPPPALQARDGELRAVPLRWKPVLSGDVAGYVVERALGDEQEFRRIAVVEGRFGVHYVDRDPSLRDATPYRYRVRSVGHNGEIGAEASVAVKSTTAALPEAPRELEAYSHLPRRVALQWRPSDDPHVQGYVVQRSPAADGPFLNVARLEGRFASSWVDDGLGDLRVFYYRLASVNAAGAQGAPGEAVQAVTKAEPLPPIGLRIEERHLGANRLAWEPNVEEDVAGYRVLRRGEGAEEIRVVEELPPHRTSCVDRTVGAGETVAYRVVAFDVDGLESDPSELVEVRSEDYGLEARARAEGIALRWEPHAEEGFAAARVYRLGWLGRQELARVEGDRFLDTDVEGGHTYRYVVELERDDGTRAPPSAPIEATARLAPPPPAAVEDGPGGDASPAAASASAANGTERTGTPNLRSEARPLD